VPRSIVAILLLAYQAAFLNVFVPVHTRGMITLDTRAAAATATLAPRHGCCPPRSNDRNPAVPTPADRAGCAICHLATHYTPPPAADLRPAPLGLTDVLPPPASQSATRPALILPYHGRAPPASA
jgi:hypothetical protein